MTRQVEDRSKLVVFTEYELSELARLTREAAVKYGEPGLELKEYYLILMRNGSKSLTLSARMKLARATGRSEESLFALARSEEEPKEEGNGSDSE